jgi:hypothetical protein
MVHINWERGIIVPTLKMEKWNGDATVLWIVKK